MPFERRNEAVARELLDSRMRDFLLGGMTSRWQVRGQHPMLIWPHTYDVKDVEMMHCAMRLFVAAMPEGVVGNDVASTATL
ncbi:MAG: hypothetical protein IH944_07980 [Armatimonadetes bacterium]|nr:hypothetical protein [Armatimonadota bacterium]